MFNGRTELPVFDRASTTGDCNCKGGSENLPYMRLFLGAIEPDFIFMDDNEQPDRTTDVQLPNWEDITRMNLLVFSPDLNPIEHNLQAWGTPRGTIASSGEHPITEADAS
ncbi:hypothetical protein TNCV_3182191 [Trichonephila clavipes]|uniref:Uncharacterized protein n=1 Tax=Trichonephila clavipes TaxID=2585209 RepID=A0A8X6SH53_TRICX|nr:hypothetical protein TNCV_3182191 [Trichonephila clavipes]